MAAISAVSVALREAFLRGVRDFFLDAKTANARIKFYAGMQPATPGGALDVSNALIATMTLDRPSGAIVTGELRLVSSGVTLVGNDGVITWGRLEDGEGAWGFDGRAALEGDTNPLTLFFLEAVNVVAGGKIVLVSAKLK